MNNARRYIDGVCNEMKVGERLDVGRRLFIRAYPCGFSSIYNTHAQAFLSSKAGAAWGVWQVISNFETGDFTIHKCKESDKRYYVDPDREHLFDRMPDGTLEYRT